MKSDKTKIKTIGKKHKSFPKGIPGYSAVVYTGGTFDLPHIGHLELFEYCKSFAGKHGKVVVSLNRDQFVKKFKGRAPVMSYDERKTILSNLKTIDVVVENSGDEDSKIAIKKAKPDIIVIGMDWVERNYCNQMKFDEKWLNQNKISLVYVPRTTGLSTTLLKKRVNNIK